MCKICHASNLSSTYRDFLNKLDTAGKQIESEETSSLVDAEEQLRAVLSKLKDHCVSLEALEEQRTFRIILETEEDSTLGSDDGQQ